MSADNPTLFDQPKPWPASSHAIDLFHEPEDLGWRCSDGQIIASVPCQNGHISLTVEETDRLINILKSYREEPDQWGGITEITDEMRGGLEFVVNANGAFIRLLNTASAYIEDKELDAIIDKIGTCTCKCCGRKIERMELLHLYRMRSEWDQYGVMVTWGNLRKKARRPRITTPSR